MTGLSFLICHAESISIALFTRAVILSRIDPSNETFDYPRVNFLISFPLNRENSLQERGSTAAGVKLIQQIKDGWIHSVQSPHNVGGNYCIGAGSKKMSVLQFI